MTGIVIDFNADLARFTGAIDKATHDLNGFQRNAARVSGNINNLFSGLGISAGSILSFAGLAASIKAIGGAVIDAEIASKRLDAVFKSTGGAVGFTRRQLDGFAEALAQTTIFDDESFRNAEAELVKFGNIQGKVFTDALKLSADVASFMGTDLPTAAAQLGKSLVDPETAFGLLKKAGVALTDSQKDSIKEFEKLGDTAGAQKIILDQLQKTFGGTAEAMNTGLTGATKELSKQWDELLETLGKTGPSAKIAENSILGLANIFKTATGALEDFEKAHKNAFELRLSRATPKTEQQLLNEKFASLGPVPQIGTNKFQSIFTKEQLAQLSLSVVKIGEQPPNPLSAENNPKKGKDRKPKTASIQAFFDVENTQFLAGLEAQKSIIETARQSQLITDESYWEARGKIANLALDAEKSKLEKSLAEQQDLIKRLGSSDKDKTFDANQKVLEIQSNILAIEQKRAVANFDIAAGILASNKELDDQTRSWIDLIDPVEKYRKKLEEIDKLQSLGKLNPEQASEARFLVNEEIDGLNKVTEAAKQTKSMFEDLGMTFTSAFEDAIVSGSGFSDTLKGLEKDIVRIITRYATEDIFSNLFQKEGIKPTNHIGSAIDKIKSSDIFGSIASFFNFADGGIMTAHGPMLLKSYASGGVANSPQFAQFGEGSTPEAFVPLPDGRHIPVKMQGGGVTQNFNFSIATPDANSFRASQGQITAEMSRALRSSRRNL